MESPRWSVPVPPSFLIYKALYFSRYFFFSFFFFIFLLVLLLSSSTKAFVLVSGFWFLELAWDFRIWVGASFSSDWIKRDLYFEVTSIFCYFPFYFLFFILEVRGEDSISIWDRKESWMIWGLRSMKVFIKNEIFFLVTLFDEK